MSISLDPFASSGLHSVADSAPAQTQLARQRLIAALGSGRRGAALRAEITRTLAEAFACEATALLRAEGMAWQVIAGAVCAQLGEEPHRFRRLSPTQRVRFVDDVAAFLHAGAAITPVTLIAPVTAEDDELLGYVALRRAHEPFTPEDSHALAAVKALLTPAFAPPVAPRPRPRQPQASAPDSAAFLADVAHTIRNHLNAMHGFVELVASGRAGRIAPNQRQLLAYAHASSIDLSAYIENLLYLTRFDAGLAPINPETIDTRELCDEIAQFVELEAGANTITLSVHVSPALPTFSADRMRLRQALLNLVANALKYTPPGGCVRLEAEREPGAILLRVRDAGPGIDPADLPHLGARGFVAERTASSGRNGSGLGLATARAIAAQHGGELCCAALPTGALFTLRLPQTNQTR